MRLPARLKQLVSSPGAASRPTLDGAIDAALPIASRLPAQRLARMIPRLPVDPVTGCRDLRELAESRAPFLRVLGHIHGRGDPALRRARVRAYVVNPLVASLRRRALAARRDGFRGIGALVLSPSVECNLDCALCYNKGHRDPEVGLSLELMDRVVKEGAALGALRVSIIGGEPLLRWRDLEALARLNPEVLFTVMTSGVLLTPEIAGALAARPNVELSFSVDGLRQTNDRLRGSGSFDRTTAAMALYRDAGGMLLYSPTVTSENHVEVLGDELIDRMIELGAYMAYHHNYVLVGGQQRADLLLSAAQRRWVSRRIREVVASKPIVIVDNVETSLFRGGCQAGREYVHVNHRGEVEPCCMVQFACASDNVHDRPLAEILRSGFLSRLARPDGVPADGRGIRRCLVGASSDAFREFVEREGAAPTGPRAVEVFSPDRDPIRRDMPTCFCSSSIGDGPPA
jgi:MoaA/NifB/PqqE/SkfB family radical SAM enzyme